MAKYCFCGCGQKVPFSRRAMNTSGERVAAALASIDAHARPFLDSQGGSDNLEAFVKAGREFETELADIVHGDTHPSGFPVRDMRRWLRIAWQAETPARLGHAGIVASGPAEVSSRSDGAPALTMG